MAVHRATGFCGAEGFCRAAGFCAAGRLGGLVPLAAVAAILAADLSGLSKAEVERIWLPFAVWLPPAPACYPADRR